jgi:hypothetical protein
MTTTTRSSLAGQVRPMMAALCAALLFGAFTPNIAAAMEEKCSDFTTGNRPCTMMEEYGYCLTNAITSYQECKEGASLLMKVGCFVAYEADYIACALASPLKSAFEYVKAE